MSFLTLVKVDFLSVPLAPSSTIIKSASAKSAPMSVAPSISNAPMSTFPAVVMVASLLSDIDPANIEFSTALLDNVKAPLEAIVASPETATS